MPKGDFWTEEETARGRELVNRKVSSEEFFAIMGRTRGSFFSHCGVKRRRERLDRAKKTGNIVSKIDVPERLYEDARRRLSAPRTLTAAIFGDPAPGQSALDMMEGRRKGTAGRGAAMARQAWHGA